MLSSLTTASALRFTSIKAENLCKLEPMTPLASHTLSSNYLSFPLSQEADLWTFDHMHSNSVQELLAVIAKLIAKEASDAAGMYHESLTD